MTPRFVRLRLPMLVTLLVAASAGVGASAAEPNIALPGSFDTLLELNGIGPDALAKFQDGPPLEGEQVELLLRVLYALRRIPLAAIAGDVEPRPDATELATMPAAHRGDLVDLRGQLTAVTAESVDGDLQSKFEIDQLFRCEIDSDRLGPVVVYTTTLPSALTSEAKLPQPVAAQGVFLKLLAGQTTRTPVFAAPRVAWHPETFLGKLGVDVGLLEQIEQRSRLTSQETQAFYQLLVAAGKLSGAQPADVAIDASSATQIVALYDRPEDFVGKRMLVAGTARRAVRIQVDAPDLRELFGLDHYYEVEVLLRVDRLKPELNPMVFVFCLRELPAGFVLGDDLAQPVIAEGLFFKLWSYESKFAQQAGSGLRQIAPLIIGRTLVVQATGARRRDMMPVLLSIAAGSVAVVAVVIWWHNWSDRRRPRTK